jgi:hypothetical protein
MAAAWLMPVPACAQSDSPYSPSLTDPQNTRGFGRSTLAVRGSAPVLTPPRLSVGATGFDALGKKRKVVKRRPGEPRPSPPAPPLLPGPPQQIVGNTIAPQIPTRLRYANIYRPLDAPVRRPAPNWQDAFEPLGIRVATFVAKPAIEVTRGFDTNPSHLPGREGSWYTVVEPSLQVRSDWTRHSFGFNLRGSYSSYDTQPSLNRPFVDFKSFGRWDITRDTAINTETRYLLSTDYPGSPNLPADIAKLPIYQTFGSTVGLSHRISRLELLGKVSVDRTAWQDSQLTDGSSSSNQDRDYNQYGFQARASYELTPGFKPFVELAGDRRVHDLAVDRNGFMRDSRALTPRVGSTFELTRLLTGEISVGYLTREYDDPTLPDLTGLVFDASLIWAMTGLTTVTLTGTSRGEEVVVAGVSGALRRDVAVQVDHAFRRWLIGTLKFGMGFDQYLGDGRNDVRTSIGAAITYKLNREFWLKGEYRYDQLRSNAANVDYEANVFLIGLKLQR